LILDIEYHDGFSKTLIKVGGIAERSCLVFKIEKFPFLGAPDRRSLRVHSLNPSDLFRGSDVAEVAMGAKD
jgi:hypothetical protein